MHLWSCSADDRRWSTLDAESSDDEESDTEEVVLEAEEPGFYDSKYGVLWLCKVLM